MRTLDIRGRWSNSGGVIKRDQLPEDAEDWRNVAVDFPRLESDDPSGSPYSEDDVFSYVRLESADLNHADRSRFHFIRTAQVEDQKFWIWEYVESDGIETYVFTAQAPSGTNMGLTEKNGLSPEQYILAAYYDEVYWS